MKMIRTSTIRKIKGNQLKNKAKPMTEREGVWLIVIEMVKCIQMY